MAPPKVSARVPSGSANAVQVSVGLNVFKIVDIDIKSATMSVSAWLRMSWSDPRLAWNETETPAVQVREDEGQRGEAERKSCGF